MDVTRKPDLFCASSGLDQLSFVGHFTLSEKDLEIEEEDEAKGDEEGSCD